MGEDNKQCLLHENKINALEDKMHNIELTLTKMDGDISHIKGRIDNGMSTTLKEIHDKLIGELCPKVEDNAFWVGKFKWALVWITIIAVGGGIVGIVVEATKRMVLNG